MNYLIRLAMFLAAATAVTVYADDRCNALLLGADIERMAWNNDQVIHVKDRNSNLLGSILYRTDPIRPGWLSLDSIQVDGAYRGIGVSKLLFSVMLKHVPDVTRIESALMGDNLKAAVLGEDTRNVDEELCKRMVMKTPAYKVRASNGFTRITQCEYYIWGILLTVSTP